MMKRIRHLSTIFLLLLSAFMLGFLAFASWVMREGGASLQVEKVDGIVVLTGGGMRIREGVRLLRQGHARRLLITGVDPHTSNGDVMRLSGLTRAELDCCVTLGRKAQNTLGNAGETGAWARTWRLKRLIVVTAAYHMPRSLAELSLELPDAELVAAPVRARPFGRTPWWLDAGAVRILAFEYPKYLFAAARLTFARLSRPWNGKTVTAGGGHGPA